MLENSDASAKLMSLPQIAKYLGVTERTVYVWAQQEKIPAFKLGSAWRFKLDEIDNWIETTRTGPKNISNDELLTSPSKILFSGDNISRCIIFNAKFYCFTFSIIFSPASMACSIVPFKLNAASGR